jgi:uncharacterized protein (DUF2062 family)
LIAESLGAAMFPFGFHFVSAALMRTFRDGNYLVVKGY